MQLRVWLEREGIPMTVAAKVLRIGRTTLYGILSGVAPSIGVLYRVRRWTNGEVDIEDFITKDDVQLGEDDVSKRLSVRQASIKNRLDKLKSSLRQMESLGGSVNNSVGKSGKNSVESKVKGKSSVWGPGVVARGDDDF